MQLNEEAKGKAKMATCDAICIIYTHGVKRTELRATSSVASLGERTAPCDTLQGVTPERKKLWANLQRIVEKRGRTGKQGVG